MSNSTSLYMFHNAHAPGSFIVTRMLSLVISLVAVPICCVFLVIVFKAFRKNSTYGRKSSTRFILGSLLGNLVLSILTMALWNIGLTGFSGHHVQFCNYWGRLGGFLYGLSNFFTYCILLQRCEALAKIAGSGEMEKLLFRFMLIAVKLGTASVPFIALFIPVLFKGKTYFIEEYCIQGVTDTMAWFFLVLDTSLSGGYLFLFVLPVVIHMRNVKSTRHRKSIHNSKTVVPVNHVRVSEADTRNSQRSSNAAAVKATAIRNLKISSAAITSTFIYMVGVSLTSTFLSSEDESTFIYLHFLTWQYYAGSADVLVNAICNMMITQKLWDLDSAAWSIKTTRKNHNNNMREIGISPVSSDPNSVVSSAPAPSSLGLFG